MLIYSTTVLVLIFMTQGRITRMIRGQLDIMSEIEFFKATCKRLIGG